MIKVRILSAAKYPWGRVEIASLQLVAEKCNETQIYGEILPEHSEETSSLRLKRPSHKLLNFRVEDDTLVADAEPLKSAYGMHLAAIAAMMPERLIAHPVFSYDDSKDMVDVIKFVTVNFLVKKETKNEKNNNPV